MAVTAKTLFRAQLEDSGNAPRAIRAHTRPLPGKAGTRSGTGGFAQYAARKPMFNGLDLSRSPPHPTNMIGIL